MNEYVGGYSDWEARGGSLSEARAGSSTKTTQPATVTTDANKKQSTEKKPKLSYKHQRELGNLPAQIEKLEKQLSQLEQQLSAPGFYQSEHEQVQRVTGELTEVQRQLETAFKRWGELESG